MACFTGQSAYSSRSLWPVLLGSLLTAAGVYGLFYWAVCLQQQEFMACFTGQSAYSSRSLWPVLLGSLLTAAGEEGRTGLHSTFTWPLALVAVHA